MIYPAAVATCREHPLSEMAIMRLAPALGRRLKSMPGPSRRIRQRLVYSAAAFIAAFNPQGSLMFNFSEANSCAKHRKQIDASF
jgi:hypothetical protein